MKKVYDFWTDNEYLDYMIFELEKITQPKYLDSAKGILFDIPKKISQIFCGYDNNWTSTRRSF